jgi:hypothetical protein
MTLRWSRPEAGCWVARCGLVELHVHEEDGEWTWRLVTGSWERWSTLRGAGHAGWEASEREAVEQGMLAMIRAQRLRAVPTNGVG